MPVIGALFAMILSLLAATRARVVAWSVAHPYITAVAAWFGADKYLADFEAWVSSMIDAAAAYGGQLADGASDAVKTSLYDPIKDWLDSGVRRRTTWAIAIAQVQAHNINVALGIDGTDKALQSVIPETYLLWLEKKILDDIEKGGGMVLSGELIQKLRTGALPSVGFAARGMAADSRAAQDLYKPKPRAQEDLTAISDKVLRARAMSRQRQARYRLAHKRKSTWILRKPLDTRNPEQLAAAKATYDADMAKATADAAAARQVAADKVAADKAAKATAALQAKADRVVQKAANIAAAEPYLFAMENALAAWKVAKYNYAARTPSMTAAELSNLAADRTGAWDTYRTARNNYNAMPK